MTICNFVRCTFTRITIRQLSSYRHFYIWSSHNIIGLSTDLLSLYYIIINIHCGWKYIYIQTFLVNTNWKHKRKEKEKKTNKQTNNLNGKNVDDFLMEFLHDACVWGSWILLIVATHPYMNEAKKMKKSIFRLNRIDDIWQIVIFWHFHYRQTEMEKCDRCIGKPNTNASIHYWWLFDRGWDELCHRIFWISISLCCGQKCVHVSAYMVDPRRNNGALDLPKHAVWVWCGTTGA